ncbi:MAG: hypothetical protein A2086_04310 [Spirochaetes bacterium GWD1_27_9]|nr:MAG: hypothetical protein A2Z98_06105 [Spirochaetes bacterium GWB1_27_13]OHD22403.1 MAG: hypothetical protein A2Y34_03495 [Spirochaetes bacterium GWC1_27_15]OHD41381.1 MAG: hypothetical protein A2086_04310 [Spirochaetes bacterium GWD1_27_9]
MFFYYNCVKILFDKSKIKKYFLGVNLKKQFIVLFFIFLAFILNSKELKITVIDKDLDMSLEGVKINLTKGGHSAVTDADGNATIKIEDAVDSTTVVVQFPGYETKKVFVKDFSKPVIIKMLIQGVLEGKELVIEQKIKDKTDEQVGVSKVIEKKEMESTAKIGIIEDVMSAIKVLPGVSYAGKFSAYLSVRGGDPNGMSTFYDGFLVRYPYHWGRAYSIFNPNTVESVKFSAGIFSAKLGPASSATMEVNSMTPDKGFRIMYNCAISTQELLMQIPIGNKKISGLFLGGRITYYDAVLPIAAPQLAQNGLSFSKNPYIYDAYLKWYWQPHKRFKWEVNAFFGTDGIGLINKDEKMRDDKGNVKKDNNGNEIMREIKYAFDFKWYNYDTFVFSKFNILPTDKIHIYGIIGYEFLNNKVDGMSLDNGTKKYSQGFKDQFTLLNSLPDGNPIKETYRTFIDIYNNQANQQSFTIDNQKTTFLSDTMLHSLQTRFDMDFQLHEKIQLETGFGGTLDFTSYEEHDNVWISLWDDVKKSFILTQIKLDIPKEDKKTLNSFAYVNLLFNIIPDVFKIDVGCRVEHTLLFIGNDYSLNTYPVALPRLNMSFTPVKNLPYLNRMTLSAGVGIFAKNPSESLAIKKEWKLKDFEISIPKALTTVIGLELLFPLDIKFKIEGYYKYFFNSSYINWVNNNTDVAVNTDGYGHAAGFDIELSRKISRYVDGMISYSFIWIWLYNPNSNGNPDKTTIRGEPTERWFYPSYHRFNNLNIVINIMPTSWMTITSKLTFASGTPRKAFSDATMYMALTEDQKQVVERYSQKEVYDNEGRNDFSIPFDLKISFNFFIPKTQVKIEPYVGVEDLFILAYNPKGGKDTDPYTGEQRDAPEARFDLGIPFPSFGIKISY